MTTHTGAHTKDLQPFSRLNIWLADDLTLRSDVWKMYLLPARLFGNLRELLNTVDLRAASKTGICAAFLDEMICVDVGVTQRDSTGGG